MYIHNNFSINGTSYAAVLPKSCSFFARYFFVNCQFLCNSAAMPSPAINNILPTVSAAVFSLLLLLLCPLDFQQINFVCGDGIFFFQHCLFNSSFACQELRGYIHLASGATTPLGRTKLVDRRTLYAIHQNKDDMTQFNLVWASQPFSFSTELINKKKYNHFKRPWPKWPCSTPRGNILLKQFDTEMSICVVTGIVGSQWKIKTVCFTVKSVCLCVAFSLHSSTPPFFFYFLLLINRFVSSQRKGVGCFRL